MYYDPSGHFAILAILTTLAIGTIIGGLAGGITAEMTGQDFWSGFGGGAVSGLISTAGMGLTVTTGGLGGLVIAGGFGFGGSIVQQGTGNGWNNLTRENWKSAGISGAISSIANVITFGATNFAMRESVGLFDDIFDKSLKFGTRVGNSLSISGPALLATGMFSAPITIVNMLIDIARAYGSKKTGSRYNFKKIGFSL